MTRGEALRAAEDCLKRAADARLVQYSNTQTAEMARAYAEAGRGYIQLAKELREGA